MEARHGIAVPEGLPAAAFGGLMAWSGYLLADYLTGSLFMANLLATLLTGVWSEIMARRLRAPANIFLVPGIIPLLPGAALYYAMRALVAGDGTSFSRFGWETAVPCLGIAGGIVASSVFFRYLFRLRRSGVH